MEKDKGNFHMRRRDGDLELFAAVDAWRASLDDRPNKSEAVRRLLRLALKAELTAARKNVEGVA